MSNDGDQPLVACDRCRYRFRVEVNRNEDWRVEAQCPSCETWSWFTEANTQRRPPPDPQALEAEAQRLGEVLWQPINRHRDHPAVAWFDRVGNGVFEDDHSQHCRPVPSWIYRFTHGVDAAYIWQEEGSWFVRGWHPLRGGDSPPNPSEVFSFESALDRLAE